jgi:hypothetical protein
MTKIEKLAGFVGLGLLVAFLAPYVHKLPQADITIILLGGLALAGYDFLTTKK